MKKIMAAFCLLSISLTAFAGTISSTKTPPTGSLHEFLDNPPRLNILAYKNNLAKFKIYIDKAIADGDLDEDEVYADFKYFGRVDDIIRDFNKNASCEKSCELLTDEEKASLYTYTMYFFAYINPVLRGTNLSDKSKIAPLVNTMSSALQKLPLYSGLVYRGVTAGDFLKKYVPGATVIEKSFTSTSAGKELGNFYKWPVIMKIKSKRGRLISSFSATPGEEEVLFDKETHFKVISRKVIDKRTIIEMEEI